MNTITLYVGPAQLDLAARTMRNGDNAVVVALDSDGQPVTVVLRPVDSRRSVDLLRAMADVR